MYVRRDIGLVVDSPPPVEHLTRLGRLARSCLRYLVGLGRLARLGHLAHALGG